ncbi:sensor histidine kinase [Paenibacillus filicis]|uniref:histidine kinase n=1 Tax=Paenibacillus gyeongsangnamensis TaxID=3388067 RepID=A0ABT4QCV6_9BACL|nr:sensor histidine kinase [Paenibacillus filicis]MCZ8514714.1 sensor histidine kinase [Paenibacillus filicis]
MQVLSLPFKQAYGNLKIKHKVFALISLIMAFCFLVTYISLQYAYSIYDEQLYSKSSQLLNLSSSGVENELKKLDRLSFTIATDLQIQNLLASITDTTPEFEKYKIRAGIADKLVQYAGYEKYIYSIEIMDPAGGQAMAGESSPTAFMSLASILSESALGSGETRWIYPGPDEHYLTAAREIRSYQNNLSLTRLGTLIVRIRFDKIVEDVVAGTELKNGEMRITAANHTIYPVQAKAAGALPAPVREEWQQGYVIRQLNGQQYFLTQIRSGYLGWTYHSVIPFDQIFNKIILMKNALLIGFIAAVAAVMALAIQFARSITRPIEGLIVRMRQVQMGQFDQGEADLSDSTSLQMDEVGQLQRTFRMMVRQINELITENYAKQLTIKETQFKALQAQINPHFLYNTLESINWLAKTNGQQQISRIVEALGFLLRSSVSMKNTLICVREELDIVTNYITIQKYRFEERLDFRMEVPEEAGRLTLPKLTLQPLLENSIHYALEAMVEPCQIRITAQREEGKLRITVEDNGPGMDELLLAQVRSGEAPTRGNGIGLKNIDERIKLAFGDAYGIELDSAPGEGTRVSVLIPDETGDTDV